MTTQIYYTFKVLNNNFEKAESSNVDAEPPENPRKKVPCKLSWTVYKQIISLWRIMWFSRLKNKRKKIVFFPLQWKSMNYKYVSVCVSYDLLYYVHVYVHLILFFY